MNFSSVNRTLALIGSLADPHHATAPALPVQPQKPAFRPMPILQPFPRATPESQGVPSALVRRYLNALAGDPQIAIHQVMVLRHGRVIAQAAFGAQEPGTWKYTFSACKSVTSMAIGMLIGENKLTLDSKVLPLLTHSVPPLARIKLGELTVRHLLTMTSGIVFNEAEAMAESDWVRGCLNSALYREPGKLFRYNSLNTYLLSVLVQELSGEPLSEYLRPRLFEPLGIRNYFWEKCPSGIDRGGWGLYLCPEDFAKLAQLVLQNGCWNGAQLIPADYLAQAAHTQVEAPASYGAFNYGFQIWCGRDTDSFLFNGMLGQNALGFRNNEIVVVANAGNADMFQSNAFFARTLEAFSGDFGGPLPDRPIEYAKLQADIRSFSRYYHAPMRRLFRAFALPPLCRSLSGRTLVTQDPCAASTGLFPVVLQGIQNNYTSGLQFVRFQVIDGEFFVEYTESDETHRFAVGFQVPAISELRFHGEPYRVAACGAVARDENGRFVLKLRLDFLEMPSSRLLRFYFAPGAVTLRQSELPGDALVLRNWSCFTNGLENVPVIGAALGKLDSDYVTARVQKLFSPVIAMTWQPGPHQKPLDDPQPGRADRFFDDDALRAAPTAPPAAESDGAAPRDAE